METANAHEKDGLKIRLINVDNAGGESAAKTAFEKTEKYQKQFGLNFPIIIHNGSLEPLVKELGSEADAPPLTAIYKDGRRLRTVEGAFEPGGLEKLLKELKVFGY